ACSISSFLVFADEQAAVREVHVRRHFQVIRRGLVPEYAAGEVERRAMARAQKATLPVVRQRRLGTGLELVRRRAAQMRADAHADPYFRLDGTELVPGVIG